MNIVIAEDEPKVQRGLTKIISSYCDDWEVKKVASDGLQALEYIYENDIDVLITDIRMPNIDGLQLIAKIGDLGKNMEFLILSGYEDFNYAKKAIELGVKRYLTKPTNPMEVIDSLIKIHEDILKSHQSPLNRKSNSKEEIIVHSDNPFVEKVLEFIHLNYNKKISLDEIANIIFINPNYLCEIFKKETGKTVFEYLIEYRVKAAKKYLKDLRYKICDVCEMVGYQDSKYFSQIFKKITSMTPIEYRQKYLKTEGY